LFIARSSRSRFRLLAAGIIVVMSLAAGAAVVMLLPAAQAQAPKQQQTAPKQQPPAPKQQPQQQPSAPKPAPIDRNGVLILIRSTLLALDQANKTGNYTVLRDLGSTNWGNFRGTNAMSFIAQARVSDNIVANAAIAAGFQYGGVGTRVGATFAW
jgi:YadA-like membrane anchor domain